jgi:hypothetical protein
MSTRQPYGEPLSIDAQLKECLNSLSSSAVQLYLPEIDVCRPEPTLPQASRNVTLMVTIGVDALARL